MKEYEVVSSSGMLAILISEDVIPAHPWSSKFSGRAGSWDGFVVLNPTADLPKYEGERWGVENRCVQCLLFITIQLMERIPIRACTNIQQYIPRSTLVPTPPSQQYIWKSTTCAIPKPQCEYPASTRESNNKCHKSWLSKADFTWLILISYKVCWIPHYDVAWLISSHRTTDLRVIVILWLVSGFMTHDCDVIWCNDFRTWLLLWVMGFTHVAGLSTWLDL